MSRMMSKFWCGLAMLALIAAGPARAGEHYPDRTVRLIVGFGAGGPTDIPARFMAKKLETMLGQSVIVENKPGASGQIATNYVLEQPRDGYTLLLCTHFEPINEAVYKHIGYKLSDIAPISQISKYYYGITLAKTVPADNLEQFIAYAKAHPKGVNYATVGSASVQEIFAHQLEKLTGITMNRVFYKGGAEIMRDLLPGRVQFFVSPTLSVMPYYRAGKLRIIAVTSPERLKVAPEVPTLTEKGFGFVAFGWLGVCAGAGAPQPIISLLNRDIGSIVNSSGYRALIEKAGSIPTASTPEELQKVIDDTYKQVESTIREYHMQIE
jgi:tripartite-type tricarboxylate transporter receptor subunit TctC